MTERLHHITADRLRRPNAIFVRSAKPVPAMIAAVCWLATLSPAAGESLEQALAAAYHASAELDAERARLRATDESVARAHSGYRPTVRADAISGRRKIETKLTANGGSTLVSSDVGALGSSTLAGTTSGDSGYTNPSGYQFSVQQPIFDGFRTTNAVARSEATARAGQQNLRTVEARALLQAAGAYVDVVRDREIVKLREKNLDVLRGEVSAADGRRKAADATNADVALARARYARAQSAHEVARANLQTSLANYQEFIGHEAGALAAPSRAYEKHLPGSLADARDRAEQSNADIASALYQEEAARHVIDEIRAELLPQVTLEATWLEAQDPSPGVDNNKEGIVYGRVAVPLYEAGDTRARVRQAKHEHVARQLDIRKARSSANSAVTAAWSRLQAARGQLRADTEQVAAAATAVSGIRSEEKISARTKLDVLNAEQEHLDALIALASSRRDVVAAGYALLSSTGALSAATLGLTNEVYDPSAHLDAVRYEWLSTDIDDQLIVERPVETPEDVADTLPGWHTATIVEPSPSDHTAIGSATVGRSVSPPPQAPAQTVDQRLIANASASPPSSSAVRAMPRQASSSATPVEPAPQRVLPLRMRLADLPRAPKKLAGLNHKLGTSSSIPVERTASKPGKPVEKINEKSMPIGLRPSL